MTVDTKRPDATVTIGGNSVTGAGGDADLASSDNSDSTYLIIASTTPAKIGIAETSIPSGALPKEIRLRLRTAKSVGGTCTLQANVLNPAYLGYQAHVPPGIVSAWATTTIKAWEMLYSPSGVEVWLYLQSGSVAYALVSEIYVDTVYVVRPVTGLEAPTSPQTETNTPVVTWSNTLDPDGGAQTHYRVKIFSAAQYGAGGFDPEISTATWDSGVVSSSATSTTVDTPLADGTYRAFVKVAQTVTLTQHWSSWTAAGPYIQFTQTVSLPPAPTLAATADNTNARNVLTITEGTGATELADLFEIERSSDGGATWENLRTPYGDGFLEVPRVVATSSFSDTVNATSHTVPLPVPPDGIQEGDLLLLFAGLDGNGTYTMPAGWTEIKDSAGSASLVRAGSAYKFALGGESGDVTFTTSASEGGGARILCVRGAHPTTAPAISTGVSAATANADPDALNPANWDVEGTLWIAAMVNDGDVAVTAGPTGYYGFGNTRWAEPTHGAGVATAYKRAAIASENPGAFTQAAEENHAWTVGVRPARPSPIAYDYEGGNGQTISYRARAAHVFASGFISYSAWSSTQTAVWTSSTVWLKCPTDPSLNLAVVFAAAPDLRRPARQGIFQPLGRDKALVVSDARGAWSGSVSLHTFTEAEQDDFAALVETGEVLLLQGLPTDYWDDRYLVVGDLERTRTFDKGYIEEKIEGFAWTEVEEPVAAMSEWPSS